jgi:hypothetical protein
LTFFLFNLFGIFLLFQSNNPFSPFINHFSSFYKAVVYIIAVHIPFAGLALLPIIFNWPVLLHPVHIVFAELLIDPACSVVFEMEV